MCLSFRGYTVGPISTELTKKTKKHNINCRTTELSGRQHLIECVITPDARSPGRIQSYTPCDLQHTFFLSQKPQDVTGVQPSRRLNVTPTLLDELQTCATPCLSMCVLWDYLGLKNPIQTKLPSRLLQLYQLLSKPLLKTNVLQNPIEDRIGSCTTLITDNDRSETA